MEGPNVFLTLTPYDELGLALKASRLPHNSVRYMEPSIYDDGPSRETTPSYSVASETSVNELEYLHRIRLTFDHETKVKGRLTFGSDPARSDVLLTSTRRQYGISGVHFYITFDDKQRPVIQDMSLNGLTVSYDGQAKDERRKHFHWIFFTGYREIRVTLPLPHNQELAFNVHLPQHYRTHRNEYENKVKRFMADAPLDHEIAFDNLALRSQSTSFAPSESLSPTKRPVYLKREKLGEGAFGRVRKVVNASTGHEYAAKEFFHNSGWEKEIEIMKHLYHDHIVHFVDSRTAPKPLLVMEYLQCGNLEEQHNVSAISDSEMMRVFNQSLQGLSRLHNLNIAHRDLKPANILFQSRRPIRIKLADFGLAQDRSDLKTFCGSPMYAAPEIFAGQHYTNAVDIWSLGVIVMKFTYGLPQFKEHENLQARREFRLWGQAWCRYLIKAADDWDSDKLIDFLTQYMIRWEPGERLSATECLRKASQIDLFQGSILQTGNRSPRPGPDNNDAENASTIRGPLWQNIKRRRTTNDFGPGLPPTGSARRLSRSLLHQPASNRGQQGLMDVAEYTKRRAISDQASGEDKGITAMPPTQPPLERCGKSDTGHSKQQPDTAHTPETDERVSHGPEWEVEQSKYLSLEWRGRKIHIRVTDCWISGTDLFKASGLTGQEINIQKTKWDFELEVVSGPFPWAGTYIHYVTGLQLCQLYSFQELGNLIRKSLPESLGRDKLPLQPEFSVVACGETLISIRNNGYVNISHILKRIAGWNRDDMRNLRRWKKNTCFQIVQGGNRTQQGAYAEYSEALEICEECRLQSVAECLREFASRWSFPAAPCEIPPLPQLPSNSIDNSGTAKDGSPLSPTHYRGSHEVASFVGISQQSRLSGIRPILEPRSLSWHYNQFEASF
ncbi:Protein kinase protein rad53 [Exophiala xenobiotica]|nr:Protein kinase protein rad53 [Exophiala xenobiotica]